MTKVFDTSTAKGVKAAERYQQALYAKYDTVVVKPCGFNRVSIGGRNGV